jgi:hypothetical protein
MTKCHSCSAEAVPGKARCAKHLKANAEWQREYKYDDGRNKEAQRRYRERHREECRLRAHTPHSIWNRYRQRMKTMRMESTLTEAEFLSFWQQPCHYCGSAIATIGVDRIDSSKGYSLDNCVPCCKVCNQMKWSLGTEEWFDHMLTILKRQGVV